MKNLKLGFSLAGFSLLAVTFVAINLLTSPQFPWSLFPVFAALWWPLSVYAYARKSAMAMAVPGSGLTIVFFIAVNIITSPQFPWSLFPAFAVLWWPLGIYFASGRSAFHISLIGSVYIAAFFIAVNLITSPGFPWAFFPVFPLIWWPLSVYCGKRKNMKLLSLAGSLLIAAFFFITDIITTPPVEWAFYAAFPALVWPAVILLKKHMKIERILIGSGLVLAGYYILLNILVSPSYPWSIFVAYGILNAMISSSFWYRTRGKQAIAGSIVISALFVAAVVFIAGIHEIWVAEIALLVISSQTCVHFGLRKNYGALSLTGSITVLLFVLMENLIDNPGHLWFLYAAFPILWSFVMTLFPNQVKTFRFSLFSAATGILYYGILNLLLSPVHLWFIYPAYGLLWWPLAMYYVTTRKSLQFSLWGSLITIVFLGLINLITSPHVPWAAFPAFGLVWWPLSMLYVNKRKHILD